VSEAAAKSKDPYCIDADASVRTILEMHFGFIAESRSVYVRFSRT
jgi:hypothetical protein